MQNVLKLRQSPAIKERHFHATRSSFSRIEWSKNYVIMESQFYLKYAHCNVCFWFILGHLQ